MSSCAHLRVSKSSTSYETHCCIKLYESEAVTPAAISYKYKLVVVSEVIYNADVFTASIIKGRRTERAASLNAYIIYTEKMNNAKKRLLPCALCNRGIVLLWLLSVYPSVTRWCSVKTAEQITTQTTPSAGHTVSPPMDRFPCFYSLSKLALPVSN